MPVDKKTLLERYPSLSSIIPEIEKACLVLEEAFREVKALSVR